MPITHIATPPHNICPAEVMKGEGKSRPLLQIEPYDHASDASSNAAKPIGVPAKLPPALSHSTPKNPVSYTHLDVYKRQGLLQNVLRAQKTVISDRH